MLTKAQEKLIRSLTTKKGRRETGRCLVEGTKPITAAGAAVDFTFGPDETKDFTKLVTTDTPQDRAAVAHIPSFTEDDITARDTVLVLDGVQDPGNVGAMLRLCLGFEAGLILIESADPTSPKVIRSSVGAMFAVPWMVVPRERAAVTIRALNRPVFRLEKRDGAVDVRAFAEPASATLIAGSEGNGITLPVDGASLIIPHADDLESLNVGHAAAIALYERRRR